MRSVELRAPLGSSQVVLVTLGFFMTGQIALIVKTKIAGPAFERILASFPFRWCLGLFPWACNICLVPKETLQSLQRKIFFS